MQDAEAAQYEQELEERHDEERRQLEELARKRDEELARKKEEERKRNEEAQRQADERRAAAAAAYKPPGAKATPAVAPSTSKPAGCVVEALWVLDGIDR